MTSEQTARFLPFHALNEFMRNDYRLAVVRRVLTALPALPDTHRRPVENLTKKLVQVPGFRHSDKAPARVRVLPTADAFEKHPALVAAVLSAWAETFPGLRQKVFDFLTARGWNLFPLEVDRAKLPGFGLHWPRGEDFETLVKAFHEMYPEGEVSPPGEAHETAPTQDDICLMIVWVADRLPVPPGETEEEE